MLFPFAHTVLFTLYPKLSHPLTVGLQEGWIRGYGLLNWVIWNPLNNIVNTNRRVHGHQKDGQLGCRFGDPCRLTAMPSPGSSWLTLQRQFLRNKTPPHQKEAVLNNAIFVAAEHQWPCSELGPSREERRERPAVKRSICFQSTLSYRQRGWLPTLAGSLRDRCQVGHRLKKHLLFPWSWSIQPSAQSLWYMPSPSCIALGRHRLS